MGIEIIKKEKGSLREISESYSILNLLSKERSDSMSIAVSTAKDHSETTQTTSDRAYYVLEGELIINNENIAKSGDVVFIPKNTEYTFKGTFKSILINSPPFNKKNEIVRSN